MKTNSIHHAFILGLSIIVLSACGGSMVKSKTKPASKLELYEVEPSANELTPSEPTLTPAERLNQTRQKLGMCLVKESIGRFFERSASLKIEDSPAEAEKVKALYAGEEHPSISPYNQKYYPDNAMFRRSPRGALNVFLYCLSSADVRPETPSYDELPYHSGYRTLVALLKMLDGPSFYLKRDGEAFKTYGVLKIAPINPEAVYFLRGFIPKADSKIYGIPVSAFYKLALERYMRVYAEIYLSLMSGKEISNELKAYQSAAKSNINGVAFLARYKGEKYMKRFAHLVAKHYGKDSFYELPDAYGFWMRRHLDESAAHFWSAILDIMSTFDPSGLASLKKKYRKAKVSWEIKPGPSFPNKLSEKQLYSKPKPKPSLIRTTTRPASGKLIDPVQSRPKAAKQSTKSVPLKSSAKVKKANQAVKKSVKTTSKKNVKSTAKKKSVKKKAKKSVKKAKKNGKKKVKSVKKQAKK